MLTESSSSPISIRVFCAQKLTHCNLLSRFVFLKQKISSSSEVSMAKMAATSATKFMVLAVLVAILMLLMSTEVATAVVDNAVPQLKLGLYKMAFFEPLLFHLPQMFHLFAHFYQNYTTLAKPFCAFLKQQTVFKI